MTARAAEPCTDPTAHINASAFTLTPGNGQITIQWVSNIPQFCSGTQDNWMMFVAAEEAIENAGEKTINDISQDDYRMESAHEAVNSTCVMKRLKNGVTYSIYAQIYIMRDANGNYDETEGGHKLLYVGSVTPDASLSNAPVVSPSGSASSSNASSNNVSSGSVPSGSSDIACQL